MNDTVERGKGDCCSDVRPVNALDKLKESRSRLLEGVSELDALISKAEKDPSLLDALKTFRRYI